MKLFFFTAVGGPYRWQPLYTAHPAYSALRTCSINPSRWPKSLAKAKRNTCTIFIQLSGSWQNFCAWTAIIMWRTFRGLVSYQSGFPCWANSADVPRCWLSQTAEQVGRLPRMSRYCDLMHHSFCVWVWVFLGKLFAKICMHSLRNRSCCSWEWNTTAARSCRRLADVQSASHIDRQPDRQLTNIFLMGRVRFVRFVNLIFSQRLQALICCCCCCCPGVGSD